MNIESNDLRQLTEQVRNAGGGGLGDLGAHARSTSIALREFDPDEGVVWVGDGQILDRTRGPDRAA